MILEIGEVIFKLSKKTLEQLEYSLYITGNFSQMVQKATAL